MSDPRLMPLDTSAYLSDTGHLSTIEHGAYLLILMAMWRSRDGWLDGSDHYLARVTRMTLGRWKRIAPTVRALLLSKDGRVGQKRVHKDRTSIRSSDSNFDKKVSPGGNQNSSPKLLKNIEPKPETAPTSQIGSFSLKGEEEVNKIQEGRKTKGRTLPVEWQPREEERLYGRTVLHLTDSMIDAAAEKMRRWGVSNQHRAVARKSNWDMTFRNWLDDVSERRGPPVASTGGGSPRATSPPPRSGGGFAAVFTELTGNRETTDGPRAEYDLDLYAATSPRNR